MLSADPAGLKGHPVIGALAHVGITEWEDFATMTSEDIEDLATPVRGGLQPLRNVLKGRLKAFHTFYHSECKRLGKTFEPTSISVQEFNQFRRSKEFDPKNELSQWNRPLQSTRALTEWKRCIKPNRSDYPILSEAVKHFIWKRDMKIAAESQNMHDALERPGVYPLSQAPVIALKMQWMFKTLYDVVKESQGRSIVLSNIQAKNTWVIFKQIDDYYANCQAIKGRRQECSTLLTSMKIENWRGSRLAFLSYFENTVRNHDEISDCAGWLDREA